MSRLVFVFTAHAIDTLALRDIEREWVERKILMPNRTRRIRTWIRTFRAIPERGDRILRVVYVRDGDTIRIVTVFFDRGRRRARRASQVRS